jgi:hypothetical protein
LPVWLCRDLSSDGGSRASVEDVAAGSSCLVEVRWWEELREPVGAHLDGPVALVDESVVVAAE